MVSGRLGDTKSNDTGRRGRRRPITVIAVSVYPGVGGCGVAEERVDAKNVAASSGRRTIGSSQGGCMIGRSSSVEVAALPFECHTAASCNCARPNHKWCLFRHRESLGLRACRSSAFCTQSRACSLTKTHRSIVVVRIAALTCYTQPPSTTRPPINLRPPIGTHRVPCYAPSTPTRTPASCRRPCVPYCTDTVSLLRRRCNLSSTVSACPPAAV